MSDTSALYEPLIERDLDAIPAAARAFAAVHSTNELWIAVARFAVLAYAPSQHAKRAVMACRAAHDLREALGDRWLDMVVECARYAAESRPPWSEPPILDPPRIDRSIDLRAALSAGDRLGAERWLAAHLSDGVEELRVLAKGDAVLMLDTAIALETHLGEKGRFALLRMVIAELLAPTDHPSESLEVLIDRAIAERGSVESVRNVLVRSAGLRPADPAASGRRPPGVAARDAATSAGEDAGAPVYHLARDYAQTLIAHAIAHTLPTRRQEFLAAVHHNLAHGESFAEWSFA